MSGLIITISLCVCVIIFIISFITTSYNIQAQACLQKAILDGFDACRSYNGRIDNLKIFLDIVQIPYYDIKKCEDGSFDYIWKAHLIFHKNYYLIINYNECPIGDDNCITIKKEYFK